LRVIAIKPSKSTGEVNKVEEFSRVINTKYHEYQVVFQGEQKAIFTRNNFNKGKTRESKDGTNKLKLYIADLVKDNWSNIKELPFNSDEYSCRTPSIDT
jgi:hypothetical protein